MLRRWRTQILAHHRTGASNGPVEAANLLIKQVKRSGRGFRNFDNYRLRILLAGGHRRRETHPVTSIRTRRPRFGRVGPGYRALATWMAGHCIVDDGEVNAVVFDSPPTRPDFLDSAATPE